MDIDDFILGIRDETKTKIAGIFLSYNNQVSNFYLTKFVDDLGNDVEAVIEKLTEKYQATIDAGNYSKNDNEMGNFSDNEVQFIKTCFENSLT